MNDLSARLLAVLATLACLAFAAAPASARLPHNARVLLQQQARVGKPVHGSKVPVRPSSAWLRTHRGKPFGDVKAAPRRPGGVFSAAASTPQWIDGTIAYQSGTNCTILGQPYSELQVGGYTGYWGAPDVSYPKIGDRYFGHVYLTATGNTCPDGIADVETDIQLPAGTELAINPSSTDPNDKVRCYGVTTGGSVSELTGAAWTYPGKPSIHGTYCNATQVSNGANGINLGYRLLAQGQSFHLVFPLRSTRKLSGISEPGGASRETTTLTSGVNTTAAPYQWFFVGDRPVDPDCAALGQPASSAITDTSAHTKGFLCNWYRTGKVKLEIGEGTSGAYQAASTLYDVDGASQGFYVDQDWSGLKPGTDYHWRLNFTDTKGTASTADDTSYLGQVRTFKTTGTAPAPGTGGTPTPGGGGTNNMPGQGNTTPPADPGTGTTGTGTQTSDPGTTTTTTGSGTQTQQPQQPQDTTPAPDTRAPGLTLSIGKTGIAAMLKKGLPATASCDEGCTVAAKLQIDAKTAKSLKLGKKPVVIGTGSGATTQAGPVKLTVKLTSKAKKALKNARKLKATLVTVATDASGNASAPVSRVATLKR